MREKNRAASWNYKVALKALPFDIALFDFAVYMENLTEKSNVRFSTALCAKVVQPRCANGVLGWELHIDQVNVAFKCSGLRYGKSGHIQLWGIHLGGCVWPLLVVEATMDRRRLALRRRYLKRYNVK